MSRMSVEQRRSLLIDAAISVMSREGVANTGTRAIVAEADMAIGVFHYCFRSKDELVVEVLRSINRRSFAAAEDILGYSRDPAEVIQRGLEAYWNHVEDHPSERMLLFELTHYSLRNSTERHAAQEQYGTYIVGMQRFLDAVAALGGITWRSDVEDLARYTVATLQGISIQWLVNRDGTHARAMLSHIASHLLDDGGLERTGWVPSEDGKDSKDGKGVEGVEDSKDVEGVEDGDDSED